jgi:FMN phosphatase YigB (HAD superfamily)
MSKSRERSKHNPDDIVERLRIPIPWCEDYNDERREAADEIERLTEANGYTSNALGKAEAEIERLRKIEPQFLALKEERIRWFADNEWLTTDNERLREALERIEQWSRAYPLSIFPEPDLKKAAEVLKANGMTLDAISAHAMRHVVEGVGKIARDALGDAQARVPEEWEQI